MSSAEFKVVMDPIHGPIELHPLCVKIIDTPEFQRLRYIKQLGATDLVYPGASHTRFAHSLGVYHLAGELVRVLQRRQPELEITDQDVLCVQIAGLCHDLGHGPFSHVFSEMVIPALVPKEHWRHEQASEDMVDHIYRKYKLQHEFEKFGLNERDLKFIKEQINGKYRSGKPTDAGIPYQGRPEKEFLYEIVANKRNGIDVDKWDYFTRDCHHLGILSSFDHKRYMAFVRVINVKGERQFCPPEKEFLSLYEMFHMRERLHRSAYQHKTTLVIQDMIAQALIKADPYLKIRVNKKDYKMSTCIKDMEAFTRLTDNVFHQILHSEDKDLAESRQILQRVENRKLYKMVREVRLKHDQPKPSYEQLEEWTQEIFNSVPLAKGSSPILEICSLQLLVVEINFSMKSKNPLEHVHFYRKSNLKEAVQIKTYEGSTMLPEKFQEFILRLYCTKSEKPARDTAAEMFIAWWDMHKDMFASKPEAQYSLLEPMQETSVQPAFCSSAFEDNQNL